jgi:hypothetical protein
MNYDRSYGNNWIQNLNNIYSNKDVKIYATGNSSISSGRIYIALPADKILSREDYIKYNIMK